MSNRTQVVGVLLGLTCWASVCPAEPPLPENPTELIGGLMAEYRSLIDPAAALHRIDAKPAFTLGSSTPHPRIPPGPFEVVWSGALLLKEPGPITFVGVGSGEISLQVDGIAVLDGKGRHENDRIMGSTPLERRPGLYRLRLRYRSRAEVPARLQIRWLGRNFAEEPLPAWRLFYAPTELPEPARRELLAERGRLVALEHGCARCHRTSFPSLTEPPPGPALTGTRGRISHDWLMHWLQDPAQVHSAARMPRLFGQERAGFVERWVLADYLTGKTEPEPASPPRGDVRQGKHHFVGLGCTACHFVPDLPRDSQPDLARRPLLNLGGRFRASELAAFLLNPHSRYPDGRMPALPLTPEIALDITAYLLQWSPAAALPPIDPAPTAEELAALARKLGVKSSSAAAQTLLQTKGCQHCHAGLGATLPDDLPIRSLDNGCLGVAAGPRFYLDDEQKQALRAFLQVAAREIYPSAYAAGQHALQRAGCVRCHQRDHDRPSPLEEAGSTLGGAFHQYLPFQRTPRLSNAHEKYRAEHLLNAVREGVSGLKPSRYTYKMPAYRERAEVLVRALAEGDGSLSDVPESPRPTPADPTFATVHGPSLVGFQGYACVSCHVWNGQLLVESDPGAVGPDLTRTAGRLRRGWFDRFLEEPARSHPFTPMPAIFPRGRRASIETVLDGDPARQKEALWEYFVAGPKAPGPKSLPPVPIAAPQPGEPALVAQAPLHLPSGKVVESIAVLNDAGDLLVWDLGNHSALGLYTGSQLLRSVQGRIRKFQVRGQLWGQGFAADKNLEVVIEGKPFSVRETALEGYDRLPDGVALRRRVLIDGAALSVKETLRIARGVRSPQLIRELECEGLPGGSRLTVRWNLPTADFATHPLHGLLKADFADGVQSLALAPDAHGKASVRVELPLPPAQAPPPWEGKLLVDSGLTEGSLERVGYRAVAFPRPRNSAGEDRIMPAALAVHPTTGQLFVASLKTGELFTLDDPDRTGKEARWRNYAHGLFQDVLAMLADADALYVLHRRNLTRIPHPPPGEDAARFDRWAALPHGIADTYDYAYGLAREPSGAFVISYAPYANATLPGSGGAIRLTPSRPPEEIAYGLRNPLGWCSDTQGRVFFSDNQGEWVAANKLCHLQPGRFYGFPNSAQKEHAAKPRGQAAVWVPYGWARSINGIACDATEGKFGPFADQIFMAELMFGGAIIRAAVEEVEGEVQGACFPFWGKGLLGPLALAFDPRGSLYVGGITEPGWMAQPDRGAVFRIDFTGETPFEMHSIQALPTGFRIRFTKPVDPATAERLVSYQVEHYRYEYTGAYGSPELDRTKAAVARAEVAADRKSVELTLPVAAGRIYTISASGVRSDQGEPLVHATGAYTLNVVPKQKR